MNDKPKDKKPYEKPEIKSEDLMTFGAICNGKALGGRKEVANVPPAMCRPRKLKS